MLADGPGDACLPVFWPKYTRLSFCAGTGWGFLSSPERKMIALRLMRLMGFRSSLPSATANLGDEKRGPRESGQPQEEQWWW